MSEYVNQVLSVLSQANQTKQATAEQPQVTFEDKRGLTHMEKQAFWKSLLPQGRSPGKNSGQDYQEGPAVR